MHEFTHAVGVAHTQSRPDRDDHVTIHWENITNKYKESFFIFAPHLKHNLFPLAPLLKNAFQKFNFIKFNSTAWTTFDMPYNYLSVMHYGYKDFSQNGQITVETKDPYYQRLIGQR